MKEKIEEEGTNAGIPIKVTLETSDTMRVSDILEHFQIPKEETSHIFVNGVYSGFRKKVQDGDLVSLFPKNMALLYKWYFKKEEDA